MGSGFRTFQSGEVLTASNVQNYLMDQSVMVFAGTAARSSAIGTATETGMVTYRTDGTADAARQGFEFWDGSAWTRMLRPVGLEFVTSGSFSAVTSVIVNNCFTSSYRNYRLVVHTTANTGSAIEIQINLRASGTNSSASYYYSRTGTAYLNTVSTLESGNNTSRWYVGRSNGTSGGGSGAGAFDVVIYGPQIADRTWFTGTAADALYAAIVGGYHDVQTSYDGFQMSFGAQSLTGTYRIYGLSDS